VRLAGVAVGGLATTGAFALPVVLSNPYGIVVVILALMLWVRATLAMAVWARSRDDGPPQVHRRRVVVMH
jgi:hypothetical protein